MLPQHAATAQARCPTGAGGGDPKDNDALHSSKDGADASGLQDEKCTGDADPEDAPQVLNEVARMAKSAGTHQKTQDVEDMAMDVPIWTCGSTEATSVPSKSNWTVRRLKEGLAKRFMVEEDRQILVCSGKVLACNTKLTDLATQLRHGERIWIVFQNVWAASAMKSLDRGLLQSVFAFSGSAHADPACCCEAFEIFCQFHGITGPRQKSIKYSAADLTWRPDEADEKRLAASVHALKNSFGAIGSDFPQVKWFADYGCALLVSNVDVTRLSLQIVGPDEWGFMFRQGPERTYTSVPQSSAGKTLHVGNIDKLSYVKYVRRLYWFFGKAQQREGEKRSAAHNEQGHQKTPAMMIAVATDALRSLSLEDEEAEEMSLTNPRGGFTDVGVHTGGDARHTAWFILEGVVEILLGDHRLFRVTMAQIRIWLAERHVVSVVRDASTSKVDEIMKMLAEAVEKAVPLADEGHDMASFEARSVAVRHQLEEAVMARAKAALASHVLHPARPSNLRLSDFAIQNPTLTVPSVGHLEADAESLENRKRLGATNLGWLPSPLQPCLTWHEADGWCKSVAKRLQGNGPLLAMQFLCRNVESFVYTRVIEQHLNADTEEIDCMESVLGLYREVVSKVKHDYSGHDAPFKVEVQSRELLVVWAVLCMAHSSTINEYRLLDHYGVAIHWSDLQHLVLFDKVALDAAHKVAQYLRSAAKGDPIFSQQPKDATFRLAEEFAQDSSKMQATWGAESEAASKRRLDRWRVVLEKQSRVRELKEELSSLQKNVAVEKRELGRLEPNSSCSWHSNNQQYREIERKIQSINRDISSIEHRIQSEETPPPPLLQPLPNTSALAMRVIFFLEMPRLFQVLLRLSFMAQQMLLPTQQTATIKGVGNQDEQIDMEGLIAVKEFQLDWTSYYRNHRGLRTPVSLHATLASIRGVPKKDQLGPPNVMSYTSENDGVWHPDTLIPGLWWSGGNLIPDMRGGKYFDPWKPIPAKITENYWVEALPADRRNMQWAMALDGKDRGNLGLANQNTRPSWLSKPQFLSFASVRAFPNLQDRKVCVALHDRSLPLEQVAVRKLIGQALFQLGQLSDELDPKQVWKTDRLLGDLWTTLQDELKSLADEIRNKPRDHGKLLVIAEVAAYAGQWDSGSRGVARQLGAIARTWADALREELKCMDAATPDEQKELASQRAKCCLFSMLAIVSYAGVAELTRDDARQLCNLSLLAESNRIFEERTSFETAVRELTVITQDILIARLGEMLALVEQDASMLTASAKLILEQTPDSLEWERIWYSTEPSSNVETSCFESVSSDGDLYTINLLKGTVLFNGLPPSRLPISILKHPLFRRCFANRNFEVVKRGAKLETSRLVRGCLYTFVLTSSQQLIIEEVHPDKNMVLELLDGTSEGVGKWAGQLPIRLQTMHSHWVCRSPPPELVCEHWQKVTLGGTLLVGKEVALHSLTDRKYNKTTGELQRFDDEKKRWEVKIASGDDDAGMTLCIKPENLEARARSRAQTLRHFQPAALEFILLRPVDFNQRHVHFFICNRRGVDEWHCFQIPNHLQSETIQLSKLQHELVFFDQLVLVSDKSSPLRILNKFESSQFTHAFRGAEGGRPFIILDFPRFDLSFRLSHGKLVSHNFLGYHLAPHQQMHNELLSFDKYLILQSDDLKSKIIVPSGNVVRGEDAAGGRTVTIETERGHDEKSSLQIHAYDVHPRLKTLTARSVEARLQLAVLYAATSSLLPEHGSQKTGTERALELVRESWVNRPLETWEKHHLERIRDFDEHAPSLSLLCQEIVQSSQELSFLHNASGRAGRDLRYRGGFDRHFSDAASDYIARKQAGKLNERAKLASHEEIDLLGHEVAVKCAGRDLPRFGNLQGTLPCVLHLIGESDLIGERLAALKREQRRGKEAFPFAVRETTAMGKKMMSDLEESWDSYCNLGQVHLSKTFEEAQRDLTECLGLVQGGREEIEAGLLRVLTYIPAATSLPSPVPHSLAMAEQHCLPVSWHVPAFRLKQIANLIPIPSRSDLAKLAFAPDGIRTFNPFLSEGASQAIHSGVLQWLQLCVLEDKLRRMLDLAKKQGPAKSALERELEDTGRAWSVKDYPEWLVFEMEQQLQIRRVQFSVASHLMNKPGAIAQLNMGEGKTRVILPMLILHGQPVDSVFRLHVLSPLLGEAYDYFHRTLTASLMCRRVHVLPFNRDVKLDARSVRIIKQSLTRCQQLRGFVCITPEHRLSMHLKWHELRVSSATCVVAEELASVYDLPYFDVMDESDEILRHKHQLVYAVGECQRLPSGKERWETIHALLGRLQADEEVVRILKRPEVASITICSDKRAGAFDQIRLIAGRELEECRSSLIRNLARSVLEAPPDSMRWLSKLDSKGPKDAILRFITDPAESMNAVDAVLERNEEGLDVRHEQVLALRACLAVGILEHCLTRRHRVDFGIRPTKGKGEEEGSPSRSENPTGISAAQGRRIAVPFRASDTPAERAEYAQPDTTILFTYIAYYDNGLSTEHLKEAIDALLLLGPMAQAAEYNGWFDRSKSLMTMEEQEQLDSVNKIDPSSARMSNLMHKFFRYNTKTIHFWLSNVVLPLETMVFPRRLVANAWNLADNARKNVLGFSGTNDNKLLLPLQLNQSTPAVPQLEATDGKMLATFMKNSKVNCLEHNVNISDQVLSRAIKEHGCSALIDAGALMAGLSNLEVADKIRFKLKEIDCKLKGVVYFDYSAHEWSFRNKVGRTWSLASSPVQEREAFVYFDESRCRGADMKLDTSAVALLTIGPGMCKDKAMQAAFRMRQLDRGQTLQLLLPREVSIKVRHLAGKDKANDVGNNLSPKDVLEWIFSNTVESTSGGLPEWASQGSLFCTTKRNPSLRLLDGRQGLADLYGAALRKEKVKTVIHDGQERFRERCGAHATVLEEMLHQITSRGETYGSDVFVEGTGLDDECERELENERALEQECEQQIPRQIASVEIDWDFGCIFKAEHPKHLPKLASVTPLRTKTRTSQFKSILWDPGEQIYMTLNFWQTVGSDIAGTQLSDLAQFLRPVDCALQFGSSGALLLLSERETNSILPLMWKEMHDGGEPNVFLIHLSYMKSETSQQGLSLRMPARKQPRTIISDAMIASLQLFNGETMFAPGPKQALDAMLQQSQAKTVASKFTELRATQHLLARSDLETISNADLH